MSCFKQCILGPEHERKEKIILHKLEFILVLIFDTFSSLRFLQTILALLWY